MSQAACDPCNATSADRKPSVSPRSLGVALAIAFVVFRSNSLEDDFGQQFESEFDTIPQISHVTWSGNDTVRSTPRSLRGSSGGEPYQYRWDFPEGGAQVGVPVQTRILALDFYGRPAKSASCSLLHVNVSLGSSARLVRPLDALQWHEGELRVDIIDEVAEEVDAEIRIGGINPLADVLLYSSRFRFIAGPPEDFSLSLRPLGSVPVYDKSSNRTTWPTNVIVEVVLIGSDRFGNPTSFQPPAAQCDGSSAQPYQLSRFTLRSSSPSLKVLSFFRLDEAGEARARIRGVRPGSAELWVDYDNWHGEGLPPRDMTLTKLHFLGGVEDKPQNFSKVAAHAQLSDEDAKWKKMADQVRDEFLHGWRGYKKYAWGADELMPLSRKGKDVFGNVGMTILDSLSTLWMMGLPEEFEEATEWVSSELDFDKHSGGQAREVSVFEVVIRALGGLLGAYTLSGRQLFLDRAADLGERLLPAFNTSSGMPYPRWDLARRAGTRTFDPTILAEAGSVQLEFRTLSALTGDMRYRIAADRSTDSVRQAGKGLMPVHLSPPNTVPTYAMQDSIQMGALADSYYEYLLKQWLQSPDDVKFKEMWLDVMDELPTLVKGNGVGKQHRLRLLEKAADGRLRLKQDHLSCFTPGMIALGLHALPRDNLALQGRNQTWLQVAAGLTEGCAEMWTSTATGLAPEFVPIENGSPFSLKNAPQEAAHSYLRPETAESLFYLYRATGDVRYRQLGKKLFKALVKHSKVESGFASVRDVNKIPAAKMDEMQSFVLSETFKYLYLLFSPADALNLDKYVLNTEAHPLPKFGPF